MRAAHSASTLAGFDSIGLGLNAASSHAAMRRPAHQSYAVPPPVSLSAVPFRPSVQRKCAACDNDEKQDTGLPVQARLDVGPIGDRHEQEADAIAGQVMAMRLGEPQPATLLAESVPGPVRAKAAGSGGGETIAASESQLTSGGSDLPVATRGFFEPRLGRDLSDVKVHKGDQASTLNSSIQARAFTYRNHIWLGANERAAPSFTMAHELAHVMQQTGPGLVRPRVQREGFGDVRLAEALANEKESEEGRRAKEAKDAAEAKKAKRDPRVVNLAGRVLTDTDIAKAESAAAGGAKSPGRITPIIWKATFVLHDTATLIKDKRIAEVTKYGRRSVGEGAGAYAPQVGKPSVAHDPMFGPRRPTATEFEKGSDIMVEKDRFKGMRAVWAAADKTVREAILDQVLAKQGSGKKEAAKERATAIKELEAKGGKIHSAAAWAIEDLCNQLSPKNAAKMSNDPADPKSLLDSCAALSQLLLERSVRLSTHTNLEIVQDSGDGCKTGKGATPLSPYTADQYDAAASVYLRAALEARVFPKITTHFDRDKQAGDHCDPRCFDVGKLYALIGKALGHPTGTIYGITPKYGSGAADNVWWDNTVCGGSPP